MLRIIACIAAMLFVAGCSPMERRSDMPAKKSLAEVPQTFAISKKWQTDAGEGVGKHNFKLSAVRLNDRLYTAGATGTVKAFDVNSGKDIWSKDLQAPVSAGPAVGEDKIVVGTSDGKVIALDLQGNRIWTSSASSEILAAPFVTESMVLVHTMDGGLTAFSTVDGRQLWRFTHNLPPIMLRRSSTPTVVNDKIYAGFANGKVLAIRKQDGAVEWSYDVAVPKGRTDLQRMGDISSDPVVKQGIVYAVGYQGNLVAMRQDNGQMLWDRDLGSLSGIAVGRDLIYMATPTGIVYGIDVNTGDTYWMQNELEGRILSRPVIMDDYVVVADDDGIVHWLDRNTGARVGRIAVDSKGVEATPVVQNNTLYILGRSGKLVALEVR